MSDQRPGGCLGRGACARAAWLHKPPWPRWPSPFSSSGLRLIRADAWLRGAGGVRSGVFWEKPSSLLRWGSKAPLPRDPRLVLPGRFLRDDYSIQVAINDYLDIYCPHYEGAVPAGRAETFTLFMVDREGYRGCYETPGAFKRWECNRPRAPFGPVRFSEKIQRFTPFSLGFEFQPGETYYYICESPRGAAGAVLGSLGAGCGPRGQNVSGGLECSSAVPRRPPARAPRPCTGARVAPPGCPCPSSLHSPHGQGLNCSSFILSRQLLSLESFNYRRAAGN
uniref:Ephrin RBD domain-containing protein n=1 Tax=Serinus canaria TaxID=9135 RepID=A0A8C9UFB2_SERCA